MNIYIDFKESRKGFVKFKRFYNHTHCRTSDNKRILSKEIRAGNHFRIAEKIIYKAVDFNASVKGNQPEFNKHITAITNKNELKRMLEDELSTRTIQSGIKRLTDAGFITAKSSNGFNTIFQLNPNVFCILDAETGMQINTETSFAKKNISTRSDQGEKTFPHHINSNELKKIKSENMVFGEKGVLLHDDFEKTKEKRSKGNAKSVPPELVGEKQAEREKDFLARRKFWATEIVKYLILNLFATDNFLLNKKNLNLGNIIKLYYNKLSLKNAFEFPSDIARFNFASTQIYNCIEILDQQLAYYKTDSEWEYAAKYNYECIKTAQTVIRNSMKKDKLYNIDFLLPEKYLTEKTGMCMHTVYHVFMPNKRKRQEKINRDKAERMDRMQITPEFIENLEQTKLKVEKKFSRLSPESKKKFYDSGYFEINYNGKNARITIREPHPKVLKFLTFYNH